MNAERKQLWLEALRSGRFTQTAGALKRVESIGRGYPVGHCCLGVGCEVFIEQNPGVAEWVSEEGSSAALLRIEGKRFDTGILPVPVAKWFELPLESRFLDGVDPLVEDPSGARRSLASLNDEGTTFDVIANLIERDL